MGLFSFFRNNKQESASGDRKFVTRAEEESKAVRNRGERGRRKQASQATPGSNPVDPILPEKKRARRRLVGAVALVLAAIIGLPMLMDPAPKPQIDDIAIQIPSRDKLLRPAAPTAPAAPVVVKQPEQKAGLKSDAKSEVKPEVKPEVTLETKRETKTDAPVAKAAIPAAAPEKKDDTARAQAMLDGKAELPAVVAAITPVAKTAIVDKPGKFVIQVAALASQQKVYDLQGKLRSVGIKSYTQKVATQSGERIRIRVGPFNSKEEADKVRARIVKLGLNGALVPA